MGNLAVIPARNARIGLVNLTRDSSVVFCNSSMDYLFSRLESDALDSEVGMAKESIYPFIELLTLETSRAYYPTIGLAAKTRFRMLLPSHWAGGVKLWMSKPAATAKNGIFLALLA